MRDAIRRLIERGLVTSGAGALGRRLRGGSLVLAYHDVVPPGTAPFGDRSLHIDADRFRRQLLALRETHEVVPLADLIAEPASHPRAAVTFDDAYAGALEVGLPILRELGMPCTIFVAPGILGREAMWWDLLADPGTGLAPDVRVHALERLQGRHDEVLAWARATARPLAAPTPWMRIASEAELLALGSHPDVVLGAHTWSHPDLSRLAPDDIRHELEAPLAWLRAHAPRSRPWLAYPYGHFSHRVLAVADELDYEMALRVDGGLLTRAGRAAPLALPRLNVPAGVSTDGFVLRTSGFFLR